MISYLVIGICIFLLIAVVYIASKPISMGIEARRNIKDEKSNNDEDDEYNKIKNTDKINLLDEIVRLNDLREKGVINEEEYEKAKKKLLS
tara:strand:- start:451 stop:720 length:270 start_codon:yes stop_codon:yes gene_type:complete